MKHRPQLRFLARGSLLLAGFLSLWWMALRTPMLVALRVLEETVSPAVISPNESGDWDVRIPVNDIHQEGSGLVRVNHIEFTMPRGDATLFTFSLPVFWAIMLAAGFDRSQAWGLLWGTVAMAAIEVGLLFAAFEINGQSAIAHWHPANAWETWWRQLAAYLVTGVLPFFAPILVAIVCSRELRTGLVPRQAKRAAAR